MSNFKGSTGEYTFCEQKGPENHCFCAQVFVDGYSAVMIESTVDPQIANNNAKLIADAGNVRQKIDFDLPELLDQRNELLEMLKDVDYFIKNDFNASELHTKMIDLISKCTGV